VTALEQGTDAWREARRTLVTATDMTKILPLSPFGCEQDVADEKLYGTTTEATLRMRVGNAVEPLIAEAYTEQTGRRVQRVHGLKVHPHIPWAAASPDYRVIGERRLMEAKWSGSRTRFAEGLPQDVEAQVRWQLGVTGLPVADVAVLLGGDSLEVFEVEHDPAVFDDMVAIAEDFRARLEAGGPFSRDAAAIKRAFPRDDGSEMVADAELVEAVAALMTLRGQRKDLERDEEQLETLIKGRMEAVARLVGPGFVITWKHTKDRTETDWKSIADGLLRQLPESERAALVGIHETVRPGFRPFRVVVGGKEE
jgi:putative phage-type endonuclease